MNHLSVVQSKFLEKINNSITTPKEELGAAAISSASAVLNVQAGTELM